MTALLLVITVLISGLCWPAGAAGREVKGKTIAQVLGMDGATYINWLSSHEKDSYYLGTPYKEYDYRNPKGDCSHAYGAYDKKGAAAMNCTGFVWHALYRPTKASGGKSSLIPAVTGWVTFYQKYQISRRYFTSKAEMLASGYLEKGDIIWMFVGNSETALSNYHHVGIYWGDGHSDVLWHSSSVTGTSAKANVISKIIPVRDQKVLYVAIKAGGVSSTAGNTPLAAPAVTRITNTVSGPKLSWSKVAGAARYRVFAGSASGWRRLGDVTGTSFTDKSAKSGASRTYTVRCVSSDGKRYVSPYDKAGWTNTFIAAPQITSAAVTAKGVALTWGKVAGAKKYRVFVKTAAGWKRLGVVSGTTFTDLSAKPGGSYTYTVRCLSADGQRYTSAYDPAGKTIKYPARASAAR